MDHGISPFGQTSLSRQESSRLNVGAELAPPAPLQNPRFRRGALQECRLSGPC
jgi:hypothetical protein